MLQPLKHVDPTGLELEERVVDIWRCATVVKGGNGKVAQCPVE